MTITDDTFEDSLRRAIREEVRPMIREEVAPMIREELEPLIRETAIIKDMLGAQGMQLRSLQASMNYANNTLRSHTGEIHRLDILLEDLNERLATARELRWD